LLKAFPKQKGKTPGRFINEAIKLKKEAEALKRQKGEHGEK
jgi:hypothetical protein